MEDMEYWVTCSNCAWSWGPGSEDDATAAALEHHEETGHEANVSAGGAATPPADSDA
jgi:hypothetical protein